MKKFSQAIAIVIVGQTPPPYGGQAIMIARLLDLPFDGIYMHHVRMAFSKDMEDLKRLRVGKILHAGVVIYQIVRARLRYGAETLYYPPSGPEIVPALRDMVILASTRWMFSRTIFHFHAAGISEIYSRLPFLLKVLFRRAFMNPDIAIQLSEFNPPDGKFLNAKSIHIVPNGIADESKLVTRATVANKRPKILFVGLIEESKGIFIFLEALAALKLEAVDFSASIVGRFASEEIERRVRAFIAKSRLEEYVDFCGVLTGTAKLQKYADADIFCLPTFFESESFSLVTVEAMSFSLPVVVSRWRGLQSVVKSGENGYLVEPKNSPEFARCLKALIQSPELRRKMGASGRQRFVELYSVGKFKESMARCLTMG